MKNNAEYFSHDFDMRNDIKIRALRRKFSHKGYAVWCYILEVLTNEDDFQILFDELNKELLAGDFDVSVEELTEIVDYCVKLGLLQITDDNFLLCKTLKNRFENILESRKKMSDAGKKAMAKRWGTSDKDDAEGYNDNANNNNHLITTLSTPYNSNDNLLITSDNKEKNSKVYIKKIERESIEREKNPIVGFSKPSLIDIKKFITENHFTTDAGSFFDYYQSNGWKIGNNSMDDWRAAVRMWERRDNQKKCPSQCLTYKPFISDKEKKIAQERKILDNLSPPQKAEYLKRKQEKIDKMKSINARCHVILDKMKIAQKENDLNEIKLLEDQSASIVREIDQINAMYNDIIIID